MTVPSRRVREITESVTLAVSAKAKALQAAGEPVIGFGAGEPDFATPAHVVEAAQKAAGEAAMHGYTPSPGLPALRDAIVDKTRRDSGFAAQQQQVVVTNGGKQALYETFHALLEPGDEVLLPAPYWVSYPEQIRLAGGEVVPVASEAVSGYRVSVDELERARTERTKLLVFVSPSNPTGAVYPPESVAEIGAWAAEHDIWVVTDEIYEHLVYGAAEFSSLPVVAAEAADRTVIVNGVSKTYAMTGWRVGWVIAPPEVAAAITRLQSHLTSNVANVAQRAALAALTGPQDCVVQMREAFDRRRRLMVDRLRAMDGVLCPEPEGAFYAFPDMRGLLGRKLEGEPVRTSLQLAAALLERAKVALVPGEAFGAPGCARLSYALGDEDVQEGLERIAKAIARMS